MKKIWLTSIAVFLLVIAMSTSAFAKMNKDAGWLSVDNVAIGGITMGMTQDEVASIYGQPDTSKDYGVSKESGAYTIMWKYGDTFTVWFANGYVDGATTTANNGIQTPAGIHVGSPVGDIWKSYGQPWLEQNNKTSYSYWYHTECGRKLFIDVKNKHVTRVAMGYE